MPCRSYYDDHPDAYYESTSIGLKKQVSFAESALCQTLDAFERVLKEFGEHADELSTDPMDYIDYKQAGITRKELEEWRKEHKRLDAMAEAARLKKLEADKKKLEAKKAVMAKLTEEELIAFGLKRKPRAK